MFGIFGKKNQKPVYDAAARMDETQMVLNWLGWNKDRLPMPNKGETSLRLSYMYRYGDAAQALMLAEGIRLVHTQWSDHLYVSQENPSKLDVLV
jgi:hypothetical protein